MADENATPRPMAKVMTTGAPRPPRNAGVLVRLGWHTTTALRINSSTTWLR